MTRRQITIIATAGCCIIGLSNLAAAQTSAGAFSDLSGSLKRGRTVSVTDDAGRKVEGRLIDVSTTSLKLRVDGKEETLPQSRVQRVAERRHMTGRYSLIGLALGAGIGVIAGLGTDTDCFGCLSRGDTTAAATMVFGGLGAGVGAVVGRFVARERVVYRADPRQALTMTIVPLTSARGTGVLATVRF